MFSCRAVDSCGLSFRVASFPVLIHQLSLDGVACEFCVTLHPHLFQNTRPIGADSAIAKREHTGNLTNGLPEAMRRSTSNSRSDRDSCGRRSPPLSRSKMRFSARAALMYLPPLMTLLTALTNSARGLSLVIYPDAPAVKARRANCPPECRL